MSVSFAQIQLALTRYPNGLTAKQVSEVMGISRQTASNRLSRMAAYRYVDKIKIPNQHAPIYRPIGDK